VNLSSRSSPAHCILSITPIKMASVSSPTSLASFSYQHAQSSRYPHVPLSPVHGTEGIAVAAVQGDGVWTYDVSAAVALSTRSCIYFKIGMLMCESPRYRQYDQSRLSRYPPLRFSPRLQSAFTPRVESRRIAAKRSKRPSRA
jgi:hypothetical protein